MFKDPFDAEFLSKHNKLGIFYIIKTKIIVYLKVIG